MKHVVRSKIFIAGIAVFLVVMGFFIAKNIDTRRVLLTETVTIPTEIQQPAPPVQTTLFFVGDIMLDRGVKNSVLKNFNGNYSMLFKNLPELNDADILFGNLEGAVSDKGNNVGSKFSFRMDPLVIPALKDAGFDIVSFANNHVGDWNIPAFTDTLKLLQNEQIAYTGAGMNKKEAEQPTIIEKNGTRFGFIGFSDVGPNWIQATQENPGILLGSDPRFSDIISEAKKQSDVLIVSFHWGNEYQKTHNARQEKLAHKAIDSGADLIIGHHPHVIQDITTYKEKPIVYSLGNFIFDQYFSKDTMEGMLFEATFEGSTLKETGYRIIQLDKKYQPTISTQAKSTIKKPPATCQTPKKEYEDYMYLNVGHDTAIPESDYIPSDLVVLDETITTTNICVRKDVADAITALIQDAKDEGYAIKVHSGFRTYQTQKAIRDREIKNGNKNALIAIAKPGHSEHQLGVAVDLTSESVDYASTAPSFKDTKESAWLKEHAHTYGFIQSYPEGKEDITGYMYEAWHYRYVGIDMAQKIRASEKTIQEFLMYRS